MLTFVADAPQGPFTIAAVNPNLLGHSPGAIQTTYFSRFFSSAPGPSVLVTHQWISRMSTWFGNYKCFLPPLKTAVVDAAGVLRLGWWPGNEAVRGAALRVALESPPLGDVALIAGTLNISQGLIFELDVNTTSVAAYGGAGLFVQTADGAGIAVLVVSAAGAGAIGPVQANGDAFKAEERRVPIFARARKHERTASVRARTRPPEAHPSHPRPANAHAPRSRRAQLGPSSWPARRRCGSAARASAARHDRGVRG
jgi:hypothetical protein